ncbi:L-rhamnose mutarotase [Pelagicoccus mobilis]|uniref:L-rhamnose mutarotase n=1 Tax=Pelagicoccus mobilis TaxID=415221 RepID=A0A934RYC8_9BACT|nr:L-rhamnose mutarotase [Pelagicoccus mobilis]
MRSYSIFLDEADGTLFAIAEIEHIEARESIARTEVCKRWWKFMAPLMEVNQDDSPCTVALRKVFEL